ncbi:jg25615 [Pararge aegeria aegeria]|uniref:Jg25615 protein n=1 Tax=Pararge aegeria aegeria TaxID=348720 RepID=A0A8S4RBZ5_9NEOP|nr:jg25615 [Pararge aegeria aegeria]
MELTRIPEDAIMLGIKRLVVDSTGKFTVSGQVTSLKTAEHTRMDIRTGGLCIFSNINVENDDDETAECRSNSPMH